MRCVLSSIGIAHRFHTETISRSYAKWSHFQEGERNILLLNKLRIDTRVLKGLCSQRCKTMAGNALADRSRCGIKESVRADVP